MPTFIIAAIDYWPGVNAWEPLMTQRLLAYTGFYKADEHEFLPPEGYSKTPIDWFGRHLLSIALKSLLLDDVDALYDESRSPMLVRVNLAWGHSLKYRLRRLPTCQRQTANAAALQIVVAPHYRRVNTGQYASHAYDDCELNLVYTAMLHTARRTFHTDSLAEKDRIAPANMLFIGLVAKALPPLFVTDFRLPALLYDHINRLVKRQWMPWASAEDKTPEQIMSHHLNHLGVAVSGEGFLPHDLPIKLLWPRREPLARQWPALGCQEASNSMSTYLTLVKYLCLHDICQQGKASPGEWRKMPDIHYRFHPHNPPLSCAYEHLLNVMWVNQGTRFAPEAVDFLQQDAIFKAQARLCVGKNRYQGYPVNAPHCIATHTPRKTPGVEVFVARSPRKKRYDALMISKNRLYIIRGDKHKSRDSGIFPQAFTLDATRQFPSLVAQTKPLKLTAASGDVFFDTVSTDLQQSYYDERREQRYAAKTIPKAQLALTSLVPCYDCAGDLIRRRRALAVLRYSLEVLSFLPGRGSLAGLSARLSGNAILGLMGQVTRTGSTRRGLQKALLEDLIPSIAKALDKKQALVFARQCIKAMDPGAE
ncbi:hypothetical protein JZM24_01915 [Candidatus Sodalis endolongispinus]|uniref:Uncharacterized protein n=1 Tax=Candidatus Sodalis endolongispinus TaxID=2812662 RepID=A0ABS5Y8G4_9GAMM|nr:hypothetical protein [Candidatus Sodalis endolongispinus]MBT9431227.1 hypothetical protein [Candidatus Sodalis endolongispinus]